MGTLTEPVMTLDQEIRDYWWHANHAFHAGDIKAATQIYRNLRREHSIDIFYEVQLKKYTKFVHPLGSVLGRAEYARHLVVYQGVSVGSTVDKERPKFIGPCVLFPHSSVLGNVTIGKNVWIQSGVTLLAAGYWRRGITIPDNVVVYSNPTSPGGWGYSATNRSVIETYFPEHTTAPT